MGELLNVIKLTPSFKKSQHVTSDNGKEKEGDETYRFGIY